MTATPHSLSQEVLRVYRERHKLEIEREVGLGGFGRVFQARHLGLDVEVAVKVLHRSLMGHAARKMFAREAKIMARMDHPNVLRVFDHDEGPEGPFLVSEWMDQGPLPCPVPDEQALREAALAACMGLQALHDAGVVHRDLKPDNLLLRQDGRIKLADLGIALDPAQTMGHHELIGTYAYMPPELFRGQPAYSAATDLYALGVTLYELWSGRRPYEGDTPWALMMNICQGVRPKLSELRAGLSEPMHGLIEALLSEDPAQRGDARQALARLSLPIEAPSAQPEAHSAVAGQTIGPWVLGRLVYEGENWLHHLGHHAQTGAAVALHRLRPSSSLPHEQILTSASRASAWEHPALVPVLDWGMSPTTPHAPPTPYVVVGRCGLPLERIVDAQGVFAESEALEVLEQCAGGLAYVHERGSVYQLLGPGSVFASASGRGVTLGWSSFNEPLGADSGQRRVFVVAYLDPALRHETRFREATDLYALGAVLAYVLTGKTVRQLELEGELGAALRRHSPTVTAPTVQLCAALLAHDPAERPASARAVAARCGQLLERLRGSKTEGQTSPPALLGATPTDPALGATWAAQDEGA